MSGPRLQENADKHKSGRPDSGSMRAPAPLAALVGLAVLAPLAAVAALPAAPMVIAGPGFGTVFGGDGAPVCIGTIAAHATYLPGDVGQASMQFLLGDAEGCPMAPSGVLAFGVVRYDLTDPTAPGVSFEYPCAGNAAAGLDCGHFAVGPFRGPGTWTWVRAAGFEGWFLAA